MAGLRELGQEYPADDAVKEGLIGKDFYESADACRYLLWNYEEFLASKAGSGATYDEQERSAIWKLRASDSIEHIFPQNPAPSSPWSGKMRRGDGLIESVEKHVGRVGNLVLLPTALNSEAKAKTFDNKKKIYEKHNLRTLREICDRLDWTLSEIDDREAQIGSWAKLRWADI